MTDSDNLTIIAQTAAQADFRDGIQQTNDRVVGIDSKLGTIAITSSLTPAQSNHLQIAAEILLDDMQTNLPPIAKLPVDKSLAVSINDCVEESISNINEYLAGQTASGDAAAVNLSAFQYLNGYFSYLFSTPTSCLLIRNEKLRHLQSSPTCHLGQQANFEASVHTEALLFADLLVITSSDVLKSVGEDFVRLTLCRFPDNLEMALRQINIKVSRTGTKQRPTIVLCRVNQHTAIKQSWIDKLRTR